MNTNIEPWKRGARLENYFSWKDCRCVDPRMPCSQNESWDPEILPTVMGKPKGKSPCEEGDVSDKHLKGPCVNCKKKTIFPHSLLYMKCHYITMKKMVSSLVQQNLLKMSTDLQIDKR